MVILSLFDFHLLGIVSALPIVVCCLIYEGDIGGGDVKLVASVGLFLGFWNTTYGLIIGLSITTVIQILYGIYTKIMRQEKKRIALPLAPFLTFGFMVTHLIY